MFLDRETFSTVLSSTPLVSIDLVVRNRDGEILLGQRVNRPAKGYWFVPGGRILKNETLAQAFERLTKEELGRSYSISDASLLGPYDHLYEDCVFGEDISTHYVAIAYSIDVANLEALPVKQHNSYQWLSPNKILQLNNVHENTKAYFR
ncbi:GDP-mannose mannosyl hydrolase [Alteromonas macleodii]|uniref:GDP-mannose mannosyl hydrolase n=1 Tax=Alteromonas macleodii TaxID=28108 RepID=UPI0020769C35|nr:GDP-mannose mannosyl hydrolase [Alteromonas macleodii]USI28210.1 GDP-mannose mannosyl hydrolase [Alteromonas macleodii]